MDEWLTENLVCPRDAQRLELRGNVLACPQGHDYPIVQDVPIMLLDDVEQTLWVANRSLEQARASGGPPPVKNDEPVASGSGIDPHVQSIVASTCGILYRPLVNQLNRYPIPELRLPPGNGKMFLDVGCNWGRWCVAAARSGYTPVGIDPALNAVLAARRVSRQLGVNARFIVGDARYLPFRPESFDCVFSYSVLQHFSKDNARAAITEVARVLKPGGTSLIQLPNRSGIRSFYHQARRLFREAREFEVRYWSLNELKTTFSSRVGESSLSVDGFFGLGIQKSDIDLLPRRYQLIVRASERLRGMS